MRLEKIGLKVGEYLSGDGLIRVTPGRIARWIKNFRRLSQARDVVPMRWDHDSDDDSPVTMSQYKRALGARDTVGRLLDLQPAEGGTAVKFVLDVKSKKAYRKAKQNDIGLSPVIQSSWLLGMGRKLRDVITHVDLVNHPVDHSQDDFVESAGPAPAYMSIRSGRHKRIYAMAITVPTRRRTRREEPLEQRRVKKVVARRRRMGETDDEGDDDVPKKKKGGEEGEGEVGDDQKKLNAVLEVLADMDIIVPDDTTADNFLDRLHAALLTAAAQQGADEEGEDGTAPDAGGGDSAMQPTTMMSKEKRKSLTPTEAFVHQQYGANLTRQLDALVASGRATPDEVKGYKERLSKGKVRLSLDEQGQPKKGEIELFVASREKLPTGTLFSAEQRTQRMSNDQVMGIPSNLYGKEAETYDSARAVADEVFGVHKK